MKTYANNDPETVTDRIILTVAEVLDQRCNLDINEVNEPLAVATRDNLRSALLAAGTENHDALRKRGVVRPILETHLRDLLQKHPRRLRGKKPNDVVSEIVAELEKKRVLTILDVSLDPSDLEGDIPGFAAAGSKPDVVAPTPSVVRPPFAAERASREPDVKKWVAVVLLGVGLIGVILMSINNGYPLVRSWLRRADIKSRNAVLVHKQETTRVDATLSGVKQQIDATTAIANTAAEQSALALKETAKLRNDVGVLRKQVAARSAARRSTPRRVDARTVSGPTSCPAGQLLVTDMSEKRRITRYCVKLS